MHERKDRFSIWWNSMSEDARERMTPEEAFRAAESLLIDHTPTIELVPAFSWSCNECGVENFQRAVSHVLNPSDPYDADVIRSMLGLDDDDDIPDDAGVTMTSHPTKVTCKTCGATFRATTPSCDHGEGDG